jgi:hypothetical protein
VPIITSTDLIRPAATLSAILHPVVDDDRLPRDETGAHQPLDSRAILGLTARPLLESVMHLASSLRQDALAILRGWISRRWELNLDQASLSPSFAGLYSSVELIGAGSETYCGRCLLPAISGSFQEITSTPAARRAFRPEVWSG